VRHFNNIAKNGFVDDISGWNFINNTPKQMNNYKNSHGTSVAGIICSVVSDSKILSLKVLDNSVVFDEFALINALNYAESLGTKKDNDYRPLSNRSFVVDLRRLYAVKHDGRYGNVIHGIAIV
jgi:subtilisin family serine protease